MPWSNSPIWAQSPSARHAARAVPALFGQRSKGRTTNPNDFPLLSQGPGTRAIHEHCIQPLALIPFVHRQAAWQLSQRSCDPTTCRELEGTDDGGHDEMSQGTLDSYSNPVALSLFVPRRLAVSIQADCFGNACAFSTAAGNGNLVSCPSPRPCTASRPECSGGKHARHRTERASQGCDHHSLFGCLRPKRHSRGRDRKGINSRSVRFSLL